MLQSILFLLMAVEPDLSLLGTYTVPAPADLGDASTFAIDPYLISTNEAGRRTMNYRLPLELTGGKPIPITLELIASEGAHKSFTGPLGSAECEGKWVALKCSMRLHGLSIDSTQVRPYIESVYGTGEKADRLVEVAQLFSGDPIGTITTRTRP